MHAEIVVGSAGLCLLGNGFTAGLVGWAGWVHREVQCRPKPRVREMGHLELATTGTFPVGLRENQKSGKVSHCLSGSKVSFCLQVSKVWSLLGRVGQAGRWVCIAGLNPQNGK